MSRVGAGASRQSSKRQGTCACCEMDAPVTRENVDPERHLNMEPTHEADPDIVGIDLCPDCKIAADEQKRHDERFDQ